MERAVKIIETHCLQQPQIVQRQHIWPQQIEYQEHLCCPAADAANIDQFRDDFLVSLGANRVGSTRPADEMRARSRMYSTLRSDSPQRRSVVARRRRTALRRSLPAAAENRRQTASAAFTEIC